MSRAQAHGIHLCAGHFSTVVDAVAVWKPILRFIGAYCEGMINIRN
jgi:hypothetical protein